MKKLNSVYKKEYAKVILGENEDVQALAQYQKDKVEDKIDGVEDLIMGIEDIHDEWDHAEKQINVALAKKAEEVGITQKLLHKKQYFEEFKIQDAYKDLSTCEVCWKGKFCEKHQYVRQEKVVDEELLYVQKRREWYAPPGSKQAAAAAGPHRVARTRFD